MTPMCKSGNEMMRALDKLQVFMDKEFLDWTPAERFFMLHQLAWTIQYSFDKIEKAKRNGEDYES